MNVNILLYSLASFITPLSPVDIRCKYSLGQPDT